MASQSYIRWLGHAAFEVSVGGKKILIDPWISNPLSPVTLSEITHVDYILITHDHFDHLGEAVDIAKKTNATVVGVFELVNYLGEQGVKNTIGMNVGGSVKLTSEIEVYVTPALHSSSRGVPVGFIIRAPEGTLYHAGDTGLFSEMELLGKLFRIDVAMLPIGSLFTMDPRQAAYALTLLRPRAAIPMHYNTFPDIKQDPNQFKELAESLLPDIKVFILKPGDSVQLPIK
ncbi:metal-dependent hydrolase [Vulcanisaeta thermophila]|uniref:metal-dependent hydrolase n=1 Tax=Vulcanisaeta thermophila TaxID=867917 RepID=UPI000852B415|nr:metal-dependent hydrolase [Vulcanisaeta thermophila]